jgi:AraC-like DNA-binding protein
MKEKTLKFLERNLSREPSKFAEEAKWRQDNEVWLKWSQGIAMKIIDYMQEHKLSRADIASRLGCSPQYVSKILSGHTNFSFKTIADIEKCLNIHIMEASFV